MLNCLCVGFGGFIGSVLRYLIGLVEFKEVMVFPIKTLAVNVIGSFCIALVVALGMKNQSLDPRVVLFLKVGICGGFTTFSTFAFESVQLFQGDRPGFAVAYIVLSVVLSLAAILFAQAIIK